MERNDVFNALKHNVLLVPDDFNENKPICSNTIILTHSQMLKYRYVKKGSVPLTYLQSDNCPGNCKLSSKSSKQPPLTQHVIPFMQPIPDSPSSPDVSTDSYSPTSPENIFADSAFSPPSSPSMPPSYPTSSFTEQYPINAFMNVEFHQMGPL